MKRLLVVLSLTTVVSLVILIGLKLSNDALAVIIGVGLGMLASIPTSLVLIYLLTRQNQSFDKPDPAARVRQPAHQPPVVIVAGGNQPGLQAGQTAQPYTVSMPTERTFTIVGEENGEF